MAAPQRLAAEGDRTRSWGRMAGPATPGGMGATRSIGENGSDARVRDGSVENVQLEIARFDWGRIKCGCGRSAGHVPVELLQFLTGQSAKSGLDGHVMRVSFLYEPAIPTTAVLVAALGEDLNPKVRVGTLELLLSCCSVDSPEIAARCEAHICSRISLLYEELTSSNSIDCRAIAYEILSCIEGERGRLRSLLPAVREHLPPYLQSGPCGDCSIGQSCPRCPGLGLFD